MPIWKFITANQAIEYPNPPLRFKKENHQYYMNERYDYFYQVQKYTTGYRFAFFRSLYEFLSHVHRSSLWQPFDGGIGYPESDRIFPNYNHVRNHFWIFLPELFLTQLIIRLLYIQTNIFLVTSKQMSRFLFQLCLFKRIVS